LYFADRDRSIHSLTKRAVAEASFDQHGGRMTSPTAAGSDVTMALSPPLCHSSPAATVATVAGGGGGVGARSPRRRYMSTFQPGGHVTGSGRLSGPRDADDDAGRCAVGGCRTCAATRYCNCCCQQVAPRAVFTQPRVADV